MRKNAPWCPSNLEFIRRINGLPSLEAVKDIVFSASYLVMGLGDVYLGAPLATPIDPRHRLVTTKYNPARTWTAENSVGIGGAYLCIYGMEGPGGYQFVGRTLQMWNRYRKTPEFQSPWLLRFFDQIRFYEVSAEELIKIRQDFPQGQYPLTIEEQEFSLADYQTWIESESESIARFNQQREAAFEAELSHWHATNQFDFHSEETTTLQEEQVWPEDSLIADSPVSGSVWEIKVDIGDKVQPGQLLVILESMKMEIPVFAQEAGEVTQVLIKSGARVRPGQALVVMQ
ncbi:carboxyltransferase domain-containing protein [Nitrincola nitratireducens]|uniref:Biotinylated protein TB7.3 n=1 Tax=Nitrincola nitratireducens TaxID=1229521 RepID=W9V2D7_9GAMM|nr:Biotinylated protein TB7.3 [Nitrincola nitratireducens]